MKRISYATAVLVAVFAFGAIAASSAYAGEYGECVKAPKEPPGKFLDKGCEKPAVTAPGKYEWQPVKAQDKSFTDSSKKVTLLTTQGEIVCIKSTSKGELLGWQKNVEHITFFECTLNKRPCWNVGEPNPKKGGTIESFTLDTYLIDHGTLGPDSQEPVENEVWNEFESSQPEYKPFLAQFKCEIEPGVVVEIRVGGAVSGVFTPVSKMARAFKLTFNRNVGEQSLYVEAFVEGNWVLIGRAVLTGVLNVKFTSTVEVRPCNEVGAKEEGKKVITCEHEEPLPYVPDEFGWVDELPLP
jgi:hypothetical protein